MERLGALWPVISYAILTRLAGELRHVLPAACHPGVALRPIHVQYYLLPVLSGDDAGGNRVWGASLLCVSVCVRLSVCCVCRCVHYASLVLVVCVYSDMSLFMSVQWVSDLYGGRRACVIATFMGILCPLLLVFAYCMDSLPVTLLLGLLAFMGCLVGGPNNIITSAVAADLADDPSIGGDKNALGTVTGIINGSGSVTAAIGQLAIPVLYDWGKAHGVGYRYVWLFLILCTITGTSLMGGKIMKELYPPNAAESSPINGSRSHVSYEALRSDESKA